MAKSVQSAEAIVAAKRQLHATMVQTANAVAAAAQAAKDHKALSQSAAKAKEAADLLVTDVDAAGKIVAARVADRQKTESAVKASLAAVEELKGDLAASERGNPPECATPVPREFSISDRVGRSYCVPALFACNPDARKRSPVVDCERCPLLHREPP